MKSRKFKSSVAVALVAAAGMVSAGELRGRLPSFGTGVEVVQLEVSVTNSRGRALPDLAGSDFTVYEDGVPQQLSLFSRDQVPVSLVLMIDGSDSMKPKLTLAKTAARRFLRCLQQGDAAEVVRFSHVARVAQDFTEDQARLAEAIEAIEADGRTSLYDALYVAFKDLAVQRTPGEWRRLAVVLLSDGHDTSSLLSDDHVIDAARRSGVTVYTIGLPPASTTEVTDASRVEYFLKLLAQESGGRAYFPRELRELDGVYETIAVEMRTRYSLAYVSGNASHDGSWRRLAVHLPGRQDVVIRHRPGYYAGAAEGPKPHKAR
jgi:Ca-activated chloride channel family protein